MSNEGCVAHPSLCAIILIYNKKEAVSPIEFSGSYSQARVKPYNTLCQHILAMLMELPSSRALQKWKLSSLKFNITSQTKVNEVFGKLIPPPQFENQQLEVSNSLFLWTAWNG